VEVLPLEVPVPALVPGEVPGEVPGVESPGAFNNSQQLPEAVG
jgi:hypothetical protein